jgi:hypothetical protein
MSWAKSFYNFNFTAAICVGLLAVLAQDVIFMAKNREKESSIIQIPLHTKRLDLHLTPGDTIPAKPVLVMYASGDGGWFGEAVRMFEEIAGLGFPTVGISSRSYMKILSQSQVPVSLEDLIQDYGLIIAEAKKNLHLAADTKTILSGWSRGAAFSVLVGADKSVQPGLLGVLAIGLPYKEELNFRHRGKKIFILDHSQPSQYFIFDTYDLFSSMAPLPAALIQSSHDDFLPADKAHSLFGEDSRYKRFYTVVARNHRFSGGRDEFLTDLRKALDWICGRAED